MRILQTAQGIAYHIYLVKKTYKKKPITNCTYRTVHASIFAPIELTHGHDQTSLRAHTHIISKPKTLAVRPHLRIPLVEVGRRDSILLLNGVTRVSAHDLVPRLAGADSAGLRRGRRTGAAGRRGRRHRSTSTSLGRRSGDT